jgi:arylsulfatase A-like enzyme
MPKRPNFILFITDQQRADFLGCNGHQVLQTPNIDAIAANGVTFDRFYVASPVCMPNRASLMTGRMPSSHGVRSNGIPLSRRNVTFVEVLRDAGYETALIGKSHLQNFTDFAPVIKRGRTRPGFYQPRSEIFEGIFHDLEDPFYSQEKPSFWSTPGASLTTPFHGFNHVELVCGHGDTVGGDYTAWLLEREPNAANLLGSENQLPHDYICPQAVRTAVPEELYSTKYIAERASAWLDKHADQDQPFFLMVSFPDPHHPFNPPGHYWNLYSPDEMDTPEAFKCNDWNPPQHVRAVHDERKAGEAKLNAMGTIGCSAQEAREARALTCGMISMVDDAVGQVMCSVSPIAERDETIVMFNSDHGDHLGDHRLLLKGAEHYEQIIRIPFIWSDPTAPSGTRIKELAQTIDLPKTILERASIEPCFGMQGINLLPVMNGEPGHKSVLIQYDHQVSTAGIGPHPRVHTILYEQWRMSLFVGLNWGELYDLESDPNEFHNLWDVRESAEVKSAMLEQLARAEIEAVDNVPLPTGRA